MNFGMKDSILIFLFLIPTFLFAQYPTTGNKSRLGWQTTGDGLIWRGVSGDTVNKPNNRNYPYFQLDTVNAVLYRYIQTRGQWQAVGGGSIDIDSLIYATRFWVNSNFFPLQGGTLTGTAGAGFINFPIQSSPPATPSTGFSLYAGSTGNNISWMQPDGFFRRLVSPVTGTPRQYQFMARSYTLADSADVAALPTGSGIVDRSARWSATNTLAAGNMTDNGTKLQALLPWQFHNWTTAGRPTGVTGYTGYNTTTAFTEGYFTSQWENYITSIGAANGQVSIFSSAGKTYGTNDLFYNLSTTRVGVGTVNPNAKFSIASATGGQNSTMALQLTANNASAALSYISIDFYNPGGVLYGQFFGTASNYANAGVNLGSNSNGFLNEHNNGMLLLGAVGTNGYVSFNTGGYAVASERMRILANGNVGIATTAPSYKFHVSGTDAIGLPRGTVAQRPTIISNTTPFRYNTDSTALEYGESVGTWRQLATRAYARTLVNAISTANFANTNLTATGNRTHDWANYNFTWTNMKKFMWGADSLFKITKEFSGYTYAVMRSPSGQSLLDLQGDDDIGTNSAEIRLTDTETGNIVFINHDDRGVGTDGFRLEHYNGTNYHNMLYVNKTSRLFWVNQNNGSSGTMYEAEATISNGVSKNIIRGSVGVFNTDSINATHYFKTTNNLIRNKDVFGVYGNASGAVDTMYFRLDKAGGLHQYKKTFLHGLGTTTATTVLGKNSSNEVVVIPLNTEQYNTVTSTTSPVTLSNTVSDNLINQGGTQATFTLNMPANPTDGQVCTITYNNAITTLTIDGNGETIVGSAVITGVPGSQRKFKFYAGIGWIKIY